MCFVCMCLCGVPVFSETQNENNNRKFVFIILHVDHKQVLLEIFHKPRTSSLHTEAHKRIRILYGLSAQFFASAFSYI